MAPVGVTLFYFSTKEKERCLYSKKSQIIAGDRMTSIFVKWMNPIVARRSTGKMSRDTRILWRPVPTAFISKNTVAATCIGVATMISAIRLKMSNAIKYSTNESARTFSENDDRIEEVEQNDLYIHNYWARCYVCHLGRSDGK